MLESPVLISGANGGRENPEIRIKEVEIKGGNLGIKEIKRNQGIRGNQNIFLYIMKYNI